MNDPIIRLREALVDLVQQIVREEIRHHGPADGYSSDRLPPGIRTRKAFARILKSGVIPGAVQDGPRGAWRCSVSGWHAARARKPAPSQEEADRALAEEALRVSGLRLAERRRTR